MTALGVLLLLIVFALVIIVVLNGDGPAIIGLDWFAINTDVTGVFLTGMGSVLLAGLALWLLKIGLKRSSDRRAEMRGLRKKAESGEKGQRSPLPPSSAPSSTPTPAPSAAPAKPAAPSPTRIPGSPPGPGQAGSSREGPDEYFDTAPREK